MRSVLFALLTGLAAPALAAPFCVLTQAVPARCIFADAGSCQQEALSMAGICTANPAEITTPPGTGAFCVATSNYAIQCVFADRPSCNAEASRQRGACIAASGEAPGAPDPYEVKRPY